MLASELNETTLKVVYFAWSNPSGGQQVWALQTLGIAIE